MILNSAGDFISSRLQRVCTKYLGEYVCSRCPLIANKKEGCNIRNKRQNATPHVFLNYHKGYVVKMDEDLKSLENIDSLTKQLVQLSKNSLISLKSLYKQIDYYWKGKGKLFSNFVNLKYVEIFI